MTDEAIKQAAQIVDLPGHAESGEAKIIEVNPDYSMITRIADVKLAGPSGQMLPRLLEALD